MPTRTCCGCRATDEKAALTRLVFVGGAFVVDAAQRLPGRGAYLHPGRPDCASAALKRRAIPRALRATVSAPEQLAALLAAVGEAGRV